MTGKQLSGLLAIPAILALLLVYLSTPAVKSPLDSTPTPKTARKSAQIAVKTSQYVVNMHERAASMGLIAEHRSRSYGMNSIHDAYGNGVCIIDFNQDGFEDIFIVPGAGTTRRYGRSHWWQDAQNASLFQNHNGEYFTPVTLQATHNTKLKGFGCTVGDINHDDLPDIVIGDIGQLHLLLGNKRLSQNEPFSYQQQALNPQDWPTSMLIDDFNQDGINDILVATGVEYRNDIKVGDQQYGYQARPSLNTSDYDGQDNLLLLGKSKEKAQKRFELHSLTGQQRTLSLLKSKQGQFLAVNAKGSNSVVQGLSEGLSYRQHSPDESPLNWLNFPAVQISPIKLANNLHSSTSTNYIVANHGSRGVQLINQQQKLNQAWVKGLSNDRIDNSQIWATLIADFNNDGLDDVWLNAGYASAAINTPSRSQGSVNHLMMQTDSGSFTANSSMLTPNLSRSSRGAAVGDFNNDGLKDVVVVNNNQFASLFMNSSVMNSPVMNSTEKNSSESKPNAWVSFDCIPLSLCQGSQWRMGDKHLAFNKHQPYLSFVSARMHFTGASALTGNTLYVNQQAFELPKLNQHYRLNLSDNSLTAIIAAPSQPINDAESLFLQLVNGKPSNALSQQSKALSQQSKALSQQSKALSQRLLAKASAFENRQPLAEQLLPLIRQWQQQMAEKLTTTDKRLTIATAWLLNDIKPINQPMIDVLIGAENRLFIEDINVAIGQIGSLSNDAMSADDFCYLAGKLHYWFDEEEVLPETKLALLPKLIKMGLTGSQKPRICAIEALSYSEQTTIGSSLLPLLNVKQPLLSAAVIRAIGRLKYAKGEPQLNAFCESLNKEPLANYPVMALECSISLHKLQGVRPGHKLTKTGASGTVASGITALHSEQLFIDQQLKSQLNSTDLSRFVRYAASPINDHRFMAYVAMLMQPKQGKQAFNDSADLALFAALARKHFQPQVDTLIGKQLNNANLLKYASNQQLTELMGNDITDLPAAKAMIAQCLLRETLAAQCKRYFGKAVNKKSDIKQLTIENFAKLTLAEQVYLLTHSDKLSQRILARQLYLANNVTMLAIGNSYKHLNEVSASWLTAFLRHCFYQGLAVDSNWLTTVAKNDGTATPELQQWLSLYQAPTINRP